MNPKIQWLLVMGLLAALVSRAAPQDIEISAPLLNVSAVAVPVAPTDSTNQAQMGYQTFSEFGINIGTDGSGANMRTMSPLLGFKLPVLKGPIQKVVFSVYKTGGNTDAEPWWAQLYAFDKNIHPTDYNNHNPASPFYYQNITHFDATEDPNPNLRLIADQFAEGHMPDNAPIEIDITDLFKPGGKLADFYDADGNPTSKNGMIWFRMNTRTALGTPAEAQLRRIHLSAAREASTSPSLKITARQEPETPPQVTVTKAELTNNEAVVVPAVGGTFNPAFMGYPPTTLWIYGVGNAGSGTNIRNGSPIIGFKLPVLKGPVAKVLFSVYKVSLGGAPNFTVHMYAFDRNINPLDYNSIDPSSPFYYHNLAYHGVLPDPNPRMRFITDQFMSRLSHPANAAFVTLDITDHFRPGGALADFYDAEGNPTPKDGMIWFRLNQGVALGAGGIRINLDYTLTSDTSPKLEFTTEVVPTTSSLAPPSGEGWEAGSTKLAYLDLVNRAVDLQRDEQDSLIRNARDNNEAVPASAINYAYAAAYSMSLMSLASGTNAPLPLAIESRASFTNAAKDALIAATNAIGSTTPGVAEQQAVELARSQGALVGLYRVLSGMTGALDAAQQSTLPGKIGDGAQAMLAQGNLPYGSYGEPALLAQGLAATASLLSSDSRRADWLAYANSIWNDWKHVNDTVENARGSTGLWLYSTLLQADEMGASHQDQLKDAEARASLGRFAAIVAPSGALPDHGNTYWDEGNAYWLYASEKLGLLHNRSDFATNAANITAFIGRNLRSGIKMTDITGLVEACRAATGAAVGLSPHSTAFLGEYTDSKGTKRWDKISLRSEGVSTMTSFATLNLHDRGGHGYDNAGALSLYTSGSSVMLHSLGGLNTWANQQQGAWVVSGLTPGTLLSSSGRYAADISTRWLVNFRWPGGDEAKPALDSAQVTGFFIRLKNNTGGAVTPSVTVEEIAGAKADGTLHALPIASWDGAPSLADGESADVASAALTLDLSDYVYLLVKWKSSDPDLVEAFGINGASLMPGASDSRPATTTLLTGPGSSVGDAYVDEDLLVPSGGMSRLMLDNAGREIIHHRDIHLRSIDGALFVLDSFEFTEAGDYTVGPVWHVQNIKSIGASTVIAGDDVQINTVDSKAAEQPSNMRFEFISDSPGVTIVHNTSVPAGRHPQKEHFAATLSGSRAVGDFVKLLTVIRPGEPAVAAYTANYSPMEKRYIDYVDDLGRVIVGLNPFTTIDRILPDYAVIPGTDIQIMGRNLSYATKVFFGTYEIPASAWTIDSDRQITVRLPLDIPPTGYVKVYSNPERGEGTSPNPYTIAVALPAHQPLPESQIVVVGKKLTLAVSTVGNPQPSWQWQVSKDGGKTWEDIDGATSSTLEVSYVTSGMNGWKYRYRAENYHSAAVSFACELRVIPDILRRPTSIIIDANNDMYVGDSGLFTINRIGSDGKFVKIAGTIGTSGTTNGRFISPAGIAIMPDETLVVTDATARRIYADIDPDKVLRGEQTTYRTVSITGTTGSSAPTGIATDNTGLIYFSDATFHSISRMAETSGTSWSLNAIVGRTGTSGMVDGPGIQARFDTPTGLALDETAQVLYIADTGNHAIRIVDLAPGPNQYEVTLFAGAFGDPGSADGALLDARFNAPRGIIVDGDMLYVADTDNSTIRAIDTVAGTVATIAGSPGLHAMMDATGTKARFDHPRALAMDTNGILYVADTENGAIRKITPENKVTTPIWDDYYKSDTVPPNSKDGLLNKGEGAGGGMASLWFLAALAALVGIRASRRRY